MKGVLSQQLPGLALLGVVGVMFSLSAAAGPDAAHAEELLRGHQDQVTSVSFSPDGSILASASKDASVKLWDLRTGKLQRSLQGHAGRVEGDRFAGWVLSVAFSPDGTMVASGGRDQPVRLWDPVTGRLLRVLEGHGSYVEVVAWSPDGRTLAAGSDRVYLWDSIAGILNRTLDDAVQGDGVLAWSPDGRTLASGGMERSPIRLWNPATGELRRILQGHPGHLHTLAWSPDGKTLASGGDGGAIRLWNPTTGEMTSFDRQSPRYFLAWSPDGKTLAAGENLWDPGTGELRGALPEHAVRAGAWSPDGTKIAIAVTRSTAVPFEQRGDIRIWTLLLRVGCRV